MAGSVGWAAWPSACDADNGLPLSGPMKLTLPLCAFTSRFRPSPSCAWTFVNWKLDQIKARMAVIEKSLRNFCFVVILVLPVMAFPSILSGVYPSQDSKLAIKKLCEQ